MDPFVGPQPFGKDNTIYGRDLEISELRYLVGAKRIVLLHSPSGAGKSSLLMAANGLLAKLRASERFEIFGPARVNAPPSGTANRFAFSVINEFEKRRAEGIRPPESFADTTLKQYVAERAPQRNPLLVFDQFEEVLSEDSTDKPTKHAFFDQLGELLYQPNVWALFVIREDFLAALQPYAKQVPTHLQNRYRLDLLRREDQAIHCLVQPLVEQGRHFAPGVAEGVLSDLSSGGDSVEPLQLQVIGTNLWRNIQHRDPASAITTADFGRIDDALSSYYNGQVRQPDDPALERRIRHWFGQELISAGKARNLVPEEEAKASLPPPVLKRLEGSYLIRKELRAKRLWYELSHDRLVEPVRASNAEWEAKTLVKLQRDAALWEQQGFLPGLLHQGQDLVDSRAWAATHAAEDIERRFLADSLALEESQNRDRRRERRLRFWLRAAVAALLLAIAAGVFAYAKYGEANQQTELARAQTSLAHWTAWKAEGSRLRELHQQRAAAEEQRRALSAIEAREREARKEAILAAFDTPGDLTQPKLDALRALAGGSPELRQGVVTAFLRSPAQAAKFLEHHDHLIHALLLLDPAGRGAPVLGAMKGACHTRTREALFEACIVLAAETPGQLSNALKWEALRHENNRGPHYSSRSSLLHRLPSALAVPAILNDEGAKFETILALEPRLSAAQKATWATRLARMSPKENGPWAIALARHRARLPAGEATRILEKLLAELKMFSTDWGASALIAATPAHERLAVSKRVQEAVPSHARSCIDEPAALAPFLPPGLLAQWVTKEQIDRSATLLLQCIVAGKDLFGNDLIDFVTRLARLAPSLSATRAKAIREELKRRLKEKGGDSDTAYGQPLGAYPRAIVHLMSPAEVNAIADELIAIVKKGEQTIGNGLTDWLTAIGPHLKDRARCDALVRATTSYLEYRLANPSPGLLLERLRSDLSDSRAADRFSGSITGQKARSLPDAVVLAAVQASASWKTSGTQKDSYCWLAELAGPDRPRSNRFVFEHIVLRSTCSIENRVQALRELANAFRVPSIALGVLGDTEFDRAVAGGWGAAHGYRTDPSPYPERVLSISE